MYDTVLRSHVVPICYKLSERCMTWSCLQVSVRTTTINGEKRNSVIPMRYSWLDMFTHVRNSFLCYGLTLNKYVFLWGQSERIIVEKNKCELIYERSTDCDREVRNI